MPRNIVQLNNRYIQNEDQRRRYLEEERRKKNRFMGWILILVILLFILPTYNLVQSYQTLLQKEQQLVDLQKEYQALDQAQKDEAILATRLKDPDYAAKYARARYLYSKEGEVIYTIPDLLPQ